MLRFRPLFFLGALSVICASCGKTPFAFDVVNKTGALVPDVTITFSDNRGTWPIGGVGKDSGKTVDGIPGPIPNSADVSWVDGDGATHKQHMAITPTSATQESQDFGHLYFILRKDGSVNIVYKDPDLSAATLPSTVP